jgi:RNA polymerase sigma-70 factor (ECF subfamily)
VRTSLLEGPPTRGHTVLGTPAGRAGQDDAISAFLAIRPRLFAVALRVVGSSGEAEEVVQDAWLRWQLTDRTAIHDPAAFLVTTTTRLALNVVQSARHRHERPQTTPPAEQPDSAISPELRVEQREAVAAALSLLMERLSATERAAYILREGFAYPYLHISTVLHVGIDNARQVVRRARQRLATDRRTEVSPVAHRRLVQTFLLAAETGRLAELEDLLVAEVDRQRAGGLRDPMPRGPELALASGA